jgi:inhibitor of cysteine peptidase
MKTAYVITVIGCIFILAAGLIAGCTTPATETAHPTVTVVPTTTVPLTSSTTSPAGTGAEASVSTLFVNSTSNGQIISIPTGERVLVRLNENPTTGYIWNATPSRGLTVVSDSYVAPNTALMGAPGYHEWFLSPTTFDTYTFKAVSIRPWEGVTNTDETFSLVIQVKNDKPALP